MLHKKSEKGQAIIIIVFAIIGLIALTGLSVDGGRTYMDRREAQGAADSAAWAGGLASTRGQDIENAAYEVASQNGYVKAAQNTDVTVNVVSMPEGTGGVCPAGSPDDAACWCPQNSSPNNLITVTVDSTVNTYFAPIVGITETKNKVQATARACGKYIAPIYGGQAVVGLGQGTTDCAFDAGNSNAPTSHWFVHGGGIFSNTCADGHGKVTLDPGTCAASAGVGLTGGMFTGTLTDGFGDGFACPNAAPVNHDYIAALMPPNPCDGTPGDVGLALPNIPATKKGDPPYILPNGDNPGVGKVYCVNTAAQVKMLQDADVQLNNATLYFNMDSFSLKYAGTNGSLSGTPSRGGNTVDYPYSSYAIVVKPNYDDPCTGPSGPQSIDYRGNAGGPPLYGTILSPTACVTLNGNAGSQLGASDSVLIYSQIIGNMIYTNGGASITVTYNADQNRRQSMQPTIQLLK